VRKKGRESLTCGSHLAVTKRHGADLPERGGGKGSARWQATLLLLGRPVSRTRPKRVRGKGRARPAVGPSARWPAGEELAANWATAKRDGSGPKSYC